jgi:hypothetical protein
MSGNIWYWSFVGVGLVLTIGTGIILMRRTNRLAYSFLLSSIVNALIFAGASLWWFGQTTDSLQRSLGVAFYGISLVNVAAFDFFALASIRKPSPEAAGNERERPGQS